jgi:integrase
MGRGDGVEIRPNSIRLFFVLDGKEHRETLRVNGAPMEPTPKNIKAARIIARNLRRDIKAGLFSFGEYFPSSPLATVGRQESVAEQLDSWLSAQRIETSTRAGYESAARFWKGAIGNIKIRALLHSHILKALATRPKLTGKTINNYVSVLRESMAMAVLDKTIAANPVAEVPTAKHQKPPPDPFSVDEAHAIVGYMLRTFPAGVANYTEAKFYTGLRTGESFGLRWPDVSLPSKSMLIHESIVRGEHKDSTKTNVARTVQLNSRALAAFKAQRSLTFMAGEQVFLDPRYDAPWADERAFRRSYWAPTLKALGIRYRPPYNTRHTYATMMLMAGMKPAFCAKQMGHSIEMFHRTYAKWIDGDRDDREMQLLEATFVSDKPAVLRTAAQETR